MANWGVRFLVAVGSVVLCHHQTAVASRNTMSSLIANRIKYQVIFMIGSASSIAASSIRGNLASFSSAAEKISNPDSVANVEDIVQLKQAENGAAVSAAVLKKILETSREVDLIV